MKTRENIDLVKRFYEALWNRFDKGLIPELLTENIRFRGSLGEDAVGHQQFGAYMDTIQGAFPDFTNTIEEIISEGNRSAVRLSFRGTHEGELFGIAPTGRSIEYAGVALFRFHHALISEIWVLGDVDGLIQQLNGRTVGTHPGRWHKLSF